MELQKTDSYAKAYVEILEIIHHMGEEYKRKIPSKLLDFFEENKDINYIYQLIEKKDSQHKIFLDETIGLLSMLESKYWTTPEEKGILDKALKDNEIEYQKQLNEKYNPDNLFKKQNQVKNIEEVMKNEVAITEYKESIFKRFINKIKSIFHIK